MTLADRIDMLKKKVGVAEDVPPLSPSKPATKPIGQMAAANDKDEDVDADVLKILERH
jgi:hypothetical protein